MPRGCFASSPATPRRLRNCSTPPLTKLWRLAAENWRLSWRLARLGACGAYCGARFGGASFMANVTLGGNPINVAGKFPQKGDTVPEFNLTAKDLKDLGLKDFAGKRKVLNIVPSLDTAVCAKSTKVFNEKAGSLPDTVMMVVSGDLPFAAGRFFTVEGINN